MHRLIPCCDQRQQPKFQASLYANFAMQIFRKLFDLFGITHLTTNVAEFQQNVFVNCGVFAGSPDAAVRLSREIRKTLRCANTPC